MLQTVRKGPLRFMRTVKAHMSAQPRSLVWIFSVRRYTFNPPYLLILLRNNRGLFVSRPAKVSLITMCM